MMFKRIFTAVLVMFIFVSCIVPIASQAADGDSDASTNVSGNLNYFLSKKTEFVWLEAIEYNNIISDYNGLDNQGKQKVQEYLDKNYDRMTFSEACTKIEAEFSGQLGGNWKEDAETLRSAGKAGMQIDDMIFKFKYDCGVKDPTREKITAFLDSLTAKIQEYNTALGKLPRGALDNGGIWVEPGNVVRISTLVKEYKKDISKFDIIKLSDYVHTDTLFNGRLNDLIEAIDYGDYTKAELLKMYNSLKTIYDGLTEKELSDVVVQTESYRDYYAKYGDNVESILASIKKKIESNNTSSKTSSKSTTPNNAEDGNDVDNPKTGSAGVASAVAVMVLAGAALAITSKKKQR